MRYRDVSHGLEMFRQYRVKQRACIAKTPLADFLLFILIIWLLSKSAIKMKRISENVTLKRQPTEWFW